VDIGDGGGGRAGAGAGGAHRSRFGFRGGQFSSAAVEELGVVGGPASRGGVVGRGGATGSRRAVGGGGLVRGVEVSSGRCQRSEGGIQRSCHAWDDGAR
jgi:hypothetical protein